MVSKRFSVIAGVRPGSRATFVSAKVAKTMLAVAWPLGLVQNKTDGYPARFADSFDLAQDRSGGAQTRWAQTMRAFSPPSAALLDYATGLFFALIKMGSSI